MRGIRRRGTRPAGRRPRPPSDDVIKACAMAELGGYCDSERRGHLFDVYVIDWVVAVILLVEG